MSPGGQWCHDINGNIVQELAESNSFAETSMDFSKMTFAKLDGNTTDNKAYEKLMNLCEKILKDLKAETQGNVY